MGRTPQKCKQCGREIYFDGICISCRAENERNRILALTPEELDAAVRQICAEIEQKGKLEEHRELFTKLINYRDIDTSELARAAFQKGVFYPGELYKDAPEDVVRAMSEMLMQDDTNPRLAGYVLRCLAVCGGEQVFRAFWELEQRPRKWRERLYADPSVYAAEGGWSFDKSGNRIKTIYEKCYPMVKKTPEERKKSPVKIGVRTKEKCPKCGCRIVNLMELDGRDPRLDFLGIPGVIKAKCCPNCFAFHEGDYCKYSLDGSSEIIYSEECTFTEDYLKEEGIEELTTNAYILGELPVPLRYAADWEGGSSVGGFAFWIQDCEIRPCPVCGKPMKYLAQIQWDTVLDSMEGNAYLEICTDCQTIRILHQQT